MRILMLLILISNIIALILALIYYYLNNKVNKEYQKRLRKIYKICDNNIDKHLDELQMMYILVDISSICVKGEKYLNE